MRRRAAAERPGGGQDGAPAARLDEPVPWGRLAIFPASFGRRFAVFADAEEEFDWSRPFSRTETATTAFAALPDATQRFNEAGVVPTYLADYPVVDDPRAAAILRTLVDSGACDVGVQLHPWVTPPFEEEVSVYNSFAGNLPTDLEAMKLQAVTDKVRTMIGGEPVAYRAGRYGVGPASVAAIRAAGHRLDVSVRPLFDYSAEGGPDFRRAERRPWWVADDLLEVPMSVARVGPLRSRLRLPRSAFGRGLLARSGLLARVALTPEGTPLRAAERAVRTLLEDGARLLTLSFHTPSLIPGHTPYVRDAADLRRFWRWWDGIFALFAREGVKPVRAPEILAAAQAGRRPRSLPATRAAG